MSDVNISTRIDTRPVMTGLEEIRANAARMTASLNSSYAKIFATTTILAAGRALFEYGGRVADMSEKLGVSTKFLQQWGNALEQNGSSMDAAGDGLAKLIINQAKANRGNEEMVNNFRVLGISVDDLRTLSPEQIWEKISRSSMDADKMVAVFGKGALSLIPTMRAVASGMQVLPDFIDDKIIKKLDTAGDRLTQFKQKAMTLGGKVYGAFEDVTDTVAGGITDALNKIPGVNLPGPMSRRPESATDPAEARNLLIRTDDEDPAKTAAKHLDVQKKLNEEFNKASFKQAEMRANLADQLRDAKQHNLEVRLTNSGQAELAQQLRRNYDLEKQIQKAVEGQVEARFNNDEAAAQLYKSMEKELRIEKELTAEAIKQAQAKQAAEIAVSARADYLSQSPEERRAARADARRADRLSRTAATQLLDEADLAARSGPGLTAGGLSTGRVQGALGGLARNTLKHRSSSPAESALVKLGKPGVLDSIDKKLSGWGVNR